MTDPNSAQKEIVNYTTINHVARIKLGLTMTEYAVADLIYQLSNNPDSPYPGWCYAAKTKLGEYLGLSERSIHTILNTLLKIKIDGQAILEKHHETKHLRVTKAWYNNTIIRKAEETSARVQELQPDTEETSVGVAEETSVNKDISNKDIYNNNSIILSKGEESWKKKFVQVNESDVTDLVRFLHERLPDGIAPNKMGINRYCAASLLSRHSKQRIIRAWEFYFSQIMGKRYSKVLLSYQDLEDNWNWLVAKGTTLIQSRGDTIVL